MLGQQVDLKQFNYIRSADDLEQLRRALGYQKLNLFALSYGTRAAQVFVRAHPDSVRTIYLGSVVPIDVTIPLPFNKAVAPALERTFAACESDKGCNAAFPHFRREFHQVLARLGAEEVKVPVPGRKEPAPIAKGRVAEWIRSVLYRPSSATGLPLAIHRAARGNWSDIVDGILAQERNANAELSFGLFFSITCSGDVAFIRDSDIAALTDDAFLGDWRVRQQQAACRRWPTAAMPDHYRDPVTSPVPTLFVSGDSDPATPLWFTEHAARGFANRAEIVLKNRGHTEWNACAAAAYERLVSTGMTEGLSAAACRDDPRPPFKHG